MGAKGWLPVIAIIAGLVGMVDAAARLRPLFRSGVVFVFTAVGLSFLLKFKYMSWYVNPQAVIAFLGFGLAAAIWSYALEDAINDVPAGGALVAWLIASCTAVVLMLIATLDYGQYCLVIAACSFAILPTVLWRPAGNAIRGLASAYSILLVSFLVGAYYTSDLGTAQLAILLCPPVSLWLGRWLPIRSKPWQRAVVRIAVTLIPLATAIGLAVVRYHHEQQQEQQDQEL